MGVIKKIIEKHEEKKFQTFWDVISYMLAAEYTETEALMTAYHIFEGKVWGKVILIEEYRVEMEKVPTKDEEVENDIERILVQPIQRPEETEDEIYNRILNHVLVERYDRNTGIVSTERIDEHINGLRGVNRDLDRVLNQEAEEEAERNSIEDGVEHETGKTVSDIQKSLAAMLGVYGRNFDSDNFFSSEITKEFFNYDETDGEIEDEVDVTPVGEADVREIYKEEEDKATRFKIYLLDDETPSFNIPIYQLYLNDSKYERHHDLEGHIRHIYLDLYTNLTINLIKDFAKVSKSSRVVDMTDVVYNDDDDDF